MKEHGDCRVSGLIRDSHFYGYLTAKLSMTTKTIHEIANEFCDMYYPDEDSDNVVRCYYLHLERIRKK